MEFCEDCTLYKVYNVGKGKNSSKWGNFEIVNKYVYCEQCRVQNAESIRAERELDVIKQNIIRKELKRKPSLELCLKTGLPRKAALDQLMTDVTTLQFGKRCLYHLWLIDIDNLKALNSVFGHEGADVIIDDVAGVLTKYMNEVNDGKWKEKETGALDKCWTFRLRYLKICVFDISKYVCTGLAGTSLCLFVRVRVSGVLRG